MEVWTEERGLQRATPSPQPLLNTTDDLIQLCIEPAFPRISGSQRARAMPLVSYITGKRLGGRGIEILFWLNRFLKLVGSNSGPGAWKPLKEEEVDCPVGSREFVLPWLQLINY